MQLYVKKTLSGGAISIKKSHRGIAFKKGGTILLSTKLGTGIEENTLEKPSESLNKVNTQLKKLSVRGKKNIRFMI